MGTHSEDRRIFSKFKHLAVRLLDSILKMSTVKYPAAIMLAHLAGDVTESRVKAILESAGDVEEAILATAMKVCDGEDIDHLVAAGQEKLQAMGGGSGGASTGAAATGGADAAEEKEESAKSESESDSEMGFDLFG